MQSLPFYVLSRKSIIIPCGIEFVHRSAFLYPILGSIGIESGNVIFRVEENTLMVKCGDDYTLIKLFIHEAYRAEMVFPVLATGLAEIHDCMSSALLNVVPPLISIRDKVNEMTNQHFRAFAIIDSII
jgi:hypothetical protein